MKTIYFINKIIKIKIKYFYLIIKVFGYFNGLKPKWFYTKRQNHFLSV